jgi:hypothetical protein
MGKINGGILGGFSGKVGAVVGGFHKGTAYMREHKIPSNPNTQLQQAARENMAFIMGHGRANKNAIIDLGFNHVTKGKKISAINRFIQLNLKDKDPFANFGGTQFSQGNVTPIKINSASYKKGESKIYFDIDENVTGYASADDKVVCFVTYQNDPTADIILSYADAETRATAKNKGATGMYKILSAKFDTGKSENNPVFINFFCVAANGECSPTVTLEATYDESEM